MNFADFSFWLLLGGLVLALAGVRALLGMAGAWRPDFDRYALLAVSLVLFYGAAEGTSSFAIFSASVVLNYLGVLGVRRLQGAARGLATGAIVAANLAVLAYFKYLDFYVGDLIAAFTGAAPEVARSAAAYAIPPGISFYTFQKIAFLVDSERDRDAPPPGFLDYANFAAFFPLLVAGPIERKAALLPQMQGFRFRFEAAAIESGLRWIVFGLFLKLVLADNLAAQVEAVDGTAALPTLAAAYLYGLRIYFDFAGYSFVALGLGAALGVQVTVNFRFPYVATSIREFWQRWHVALSNWFRDYLYLPLGGSRVPWVAANLLLVFAVSGLWHGAGWNYVAWGLYHGLLMVAHRGLAARVVLGAFPAWALTFALVMFGWLFFMETDGGRLAVKLGGLLDPSGYALATLVEPIRARGAAAAGVLTVTLLLAHAELARQYLAIRTGEERAAFQPGPLVAGTMLLATFLMTARGASPFVYFAF